MDTTRILSTDACMAEGAAWLAAREPRFAQVLELYGPPPLRRRDDGFEALVQAIVAQQVSVASARALMGKLEAAQLVTAPQIAAVSEEYLRENGLSRQKARYVKALAEACIDYDALRDAPEAEVMAVLTALPGIGRWTAEVYVMFSLGRADTFAPNDLALQEAARMLFDLPERPKEKPMRAMAEAWTPWRTVAAGLLWHYYHYAKRRDGVV
ncbi:DNA-3-methyladenine glycosylase 2 family protein [Cereibacter sphaeroides]|nr:DNA-3-methyladenine glycosylase 2 family protein [Cereibacter sphaeroides]